MANADGKIKALKAEQTAIYEDIDNSIEDIFVKYQNKHGIDSGDISPDDFLKLSNTICQMASIITNILIKQKGGF